MLLIDGDIVAYKVSAACEEPVHWGEDFWTLHADAMEGKAQVDIWIEQLKEDLNSSDVRVFLTGRSNYRTGLFPEYKANRRGKRKPMILGSLRDHLISKWGAELEDGLEADDLMGIAATGPESSGSIIVSIDKDLKSIPCRLYNPDRPEEGVQEITAAAADAHHFYQTLVGDSSDNYKGCPNCGPKKAEGLLSIIRPWNREETWEKILQIFDRAGLSSKHALTQAQVARILRHGDYNFETKEVKLWKPKSKRKERKKQSS